MNTEGYLSSTCMSNDVTAGGRKTIDEGAVLVTVMDEEFVFSDEAEEEEESVPSLDEEESDWESDDEEEEMDDEEGEPCLCFCVAFV